MNESTKATIEILEHYHHNGGFYEIPVEVINTVEQELEELDKLLQQKENIIKGLDNTIENLEEVVEHKDNIIKEVRECVKEANEWVLGVGLKAILLEILDKEK